MEFWSTIVGLLRRPRVIIPAVLGALSLGVVVFLATPSTYTSSTTMVLSTTAYGGTQSQDPTDPTDLTNPMLNFNESLKTTSAILITAMGTKDVLEQLGATRGSTQLIVNDGRTNPDLLGLNGPFLYIEVRSISAEDARRVLVDAQKLTRQKLVEWQSAMKAPQNTYVSLVDVVPPTVPEASSGRAVKLGLMAFLFSFVLCVGIAYLNHQIRARRRARAAAAPAVVNSAPPLGGVPEQVRPRRPAPSPVLLSEVEDEERSVPVVAPVPLKKSARSRNR